MVGQTEATALSISEKHALDQLEASIEKNLAAFSEVGNALLRIRSERLYRTQFETFEQYCEARWSRHRRWANQLIQAVEVAENLGAMAPNVTERQLRPLASLEPDQQREAWKRAVETAPDGRVTAEHVENTVKELAGGVRLKTCGECGKQWAADLPFCPYCNLSPEAREHGLNQHHVETKEKSLDVHYSSESPEWYTPPEIVERTVKLFGKIGLDPCSNSAKEPNIPASKHYTQKDDGLSKDWAGKVYMNPPYGREIVGWVEKLVAEYEAGRVTEAIALVPSRTDTEWFRMLREHPRCFISGRLNFSGHENSAPFPSVVIYLGKNAERFVKAFGDIGDVYSLIS